MASYAQAAAFLESFIDYERHRGRMQYGTRTLHLRRFERFLRQIGSPHRAGAVIHVAGTKGKGSTAAILHSITTEAGLRSGLYTSPHLESYCERIQIDRAPVSKRRFAAAVESLRFRLECHGVRLESGYRTTFELLTAIALEIFRDEQVSLGILETGLGGRLDATNVVVPELAVITPIGLDHTHLLGRTFRAIAREKAGIVKANRPVVLAGQVPGAAHDVLAVVRTVCRRRRSPLVYAPRRVEILSRTEGSHGQTVRCRLRRSAREFVCRLPLLGGHQAQNLCTALAAIELLRARGWTIPDHAIVAGAERVRWPGRIEWLEGNPPLLVDGAHCPLSVGALARTLRDCGAGRRPVFLFSLLDDKPVADTVEPIARVFQGGEMVVFRAPSVRGRPAAGLLAPLRQMGFAVEAARGPAHALARAIARSHGNTLLVAFGSLYSVAPLRKAYRRLTGSHTGA